MHISLLSLQDFRGFRELSLPLHPKLNIVYGVNGTGKSTILDATAILLSWLASRIRMHNGKGKFPTESEIHNDALLTQLSLTLGCKNKQTHWQIVKRRRERNIRDAKVSRTSLVFLSNLAQEIRGSNFAEGAVLSLPVFAHYSVHRAVLCCALRPNMADGISSLLFLPTCMHCPVMQISRPFSPGSVGLNAWEKRTSAEIAGQLERNRLWLRNHRSDHARFSEPYPW